MKEQLEAYFTKRYGEIGEELKLAIGLTDTTVNDFQTALSQCCWIFCCEWDCGLDEWHTDVLKREINYDFIGLAARVAAQSKNPSTKVGAIIVDDKQRVCGKGYNDLVRGIAHTEERWADQETRRLYTVHAEPNAIIHATVADLSECVMYVTHFPCTECAKLILESGIKAVYVAETGGLDHWADEQAKAQGMLVEAGVMACVVKVD